MLQRRLDLRPRRVDHASQADKDKILFQLLRSDPFRIVRDISFDAIGKAQHAQRILGHFVVGSQNTLASFFIQRMRLVIPILILRAKIQYHIRSAFDSDHVPVFVFLVGERRWVVGARRSDIVNRDHALALRVERHLVLARVSFLDLHMCRAGFRRCHQERPFGGIPDNPICFS
jgi:hypothetical protein